MRTRSVSIRPALAGLSLVALGACTLLSSGDEVQCETDQDCADLGDGFENAVCAPEGVCAAPSLATSTTTTSVAQGTGSTGTGGQSGGCESSEQCTIDNTGKPSICAPTGECVSLISEDCFEVQGDYEDPNAVILGVMIPYQGGPVNELVAGWWKCAVETAHEAIETTIRGLPVPDGGTRPVALVYCNDHIDHIRTARHLVDTVGVKAIIGPLESEKSIDLIENVTTEAGVMLATQNGSPLLLQLPSQGLWLSTAPNQATLLKAFDPTVARLEAEIRAEDPTIENLRFAVIHTEDVFNESIATFMLDNDVPLYNGGLTPLENAAADCDGEPCFKRFVYPQEVDADWSVIVNQLMEYKPNIIYQLGPGVGKFGDAILPLLEAETPSFRPRYLLDFKDTGVLSYLQGEFAPSVAEDPVDLASRVTIVDFLNDGTVNPVFETLKVNVATNCPDSINEGVLFGWMDMYYDATLLAVLSYLAGGNCNVPTSQITGPLLANGVSAMTPAGQDDPDNAVKKDLVPSDLQSIVGALCGGVEVDLAGAATSLDLDPVYRVPLLDIDVICVSTADDTYSFRTAQTVDGSTGETGGTYECPEE